MASVNKVILVGNVGATPEVRDAGESQVVTFSLATTERWTDKGGEKREKTEWHRVEAWGRLADVVGQYTDKGSQLYIEGSLQTDKYTDKDGVERFATKIRANTIQLLDRRQAA